MERKSVLIAILNQGWVRPELTNAVALMTHDKRYRCKVYYPSARPNEHNRAEIVKKFLEGDWDYLLMIDSDNPPTRNPLDLVELDLDIVACPTPQLREGQLYWVVMRRVEDGYQGYLKRQKGLVEADAVGTGCVLIARRVLLEVKEPFMREWVDGFQELGTDFAFCKRAKQKGFCVWAHWDYVCSHFKTVNLLNFIG